MAATAKALADSRILHLVLRHLSDMKYKDRRQRGSDQPVEFLEFRPTLVPSILVNKLWADEGTSILWRRYPHLLALDDMAPARRQWYANKVERLFVLGPPDDETNFDYLHNLNWPNLKTLELEVDWCKHEKGISSMLHAGLQHVEFLGPQSRGSEYFARTILPALFKPNLVSIHIGPDVVDLEDPLQFHVLLDLLDSAPSISDVRIMNAGFSAKDIIFKNLSQRLGLEALQIDLEPGLQLVPYFSGPSALPSSFLSLRRLHIMCYPEIALTLLPHLQLIEELQLDIARIPDQVQQEDDADVLNRIITTLAQCQQLQSLKINIGQLAVDFPSATSYPALSGVALIKLSAGCPKLEDISLCTAGPEGIDGSAISSLQFETFCRGLPRLVDLELKFHPQTAIDLEFTALGSLGKNCHLLETLRLRISCHLPDLQIVKDASPVQPTDEFSQNPMDTKVGPRTPFKTADLHESECLLDIESLTLSQTSNTPLFQNLKHLAFARPQSILSIASDTYMSSSSSQTGSVVDPLVEQSLVQSWAHPLAAQFPRLEILEAWGDWTGQDNETLNYFLPREALLATIWEFLSGVEQDLWDEEEDVDEDINEVGSGSDWIDAHTDRYSIDSYTSLDWDLASLVNEFRTQEDFTGRASLDAYDEEPEDMLTPGPIPDKDEEPYFRYSDAKNIAASGAGPVDHAPGAVACSV
ncbi:hypothetical protein COCC4DRAFT_136706 [Bipolaris maydis ATCC 48331]|uniref:Uncharacterized protein n=2 Tax=Cochliobolus heterostrophus TaxID=5016 RepID=M2T0P2_COCH5|nr:uncharacterized protein COCC4DRAFT_136706 [Bipolaris maydis ATCC 48331]EMD91185.1 hypothetical protein COCHEDRAFT_1137703 [Bipolaris maydis C5]KAJ5022881.1 hypothetical protein J3E73DRAFT_434203 [Bipolaris maydis]ENI05734.1 hypothetical protein COCC4DRAFT_136706 [Bipolaris maydis ATCC 48331]KAJ6205037.1 hypothetical protein PSV09DRAFT_1137703 [Bipolaris maydis]KAJ6268128.1 hypothetical protein PSV08DRAFT_364952 [Bipolaris maydis]